MAGDLKDQIVLDLDVLLGKVDSKAFLAGLNKLVSQVGEVAAKVSTDATVKVGVKVDDKTLATGVDKAVKQVNAKITSLLNELDPEDEKGREVLNAYGSFFKRIDTALSALAGTHSKKVESNYKALASQNSRVLSKLSDSDLAAVMRYASATNLRNKLLKQALDSSASIFNSTQDGKYQVPVKPVLAENLDVELKAADARKKAFEKFLKDSNVEARAREALNRTYRQTTIRKLTPKVIASAGEDYNFGSPTRALRREIRDLIKDQEAAPLEQKDRIGREILDRERTLKQLQNRYREVSGSTLANSIDYARKQSMEAETRYRELKAKSADTSLSNTERKAAEALAQKELNAAISQHYQVLKKLAPLNAEQSKADKDRLLSLQKEKEGFKSRIEQRGKEQTLLQRLESGNARDASVGENQRRAKADAEQALQAAQSKYREERALLKTQDPKSTSFRNTKNRATTAANNFRRIAQELGLAEEETLRLTENLGTTVSRLRGVAAARGKAVATQQTLLQRMDLGNARDASVGENQRRARAELEGTAAALRSRFADLGYRKGAISGNLVSMVGNDPMGVDGAVAKLQILQKELRDVARVAGESGIPKLEAEFKGLGNAVGKAITQVNQFDRAAQAPAKAPSEAAVRRAEKERIRRALVAEGQMAFEEVGGIKNYARIPESQYKPALEYAKAYESDVSSRFAAVRDDKTLDPGIKKKQLRELTIEFNQASKAARVLQQEINGNVGFLRQLSLASRNFARYFLFYGGMYQIIGYFQQLTRTIVDFQDALKGTQVVAQATERDMAGIGEAIRSVASNSGETLQNVASAAETLAQAGTSVKDVPAALKAVSDFALATGSSMQVAADIITSAKEIFGDKLTFAGAADQLTRAVNISKLRAEDLKTIFNLGAQTAQSSGLSSAQFLGASATLSNLGIKSSTVATGLRQLLLELFNPDEKTIAFLRRRYNELGERLSDSEIRNRFQGFQSTSNPLLSALTEMRRLGAAGSAQDQFKRVLDIRAENVGLPLMQRLDEFARNTAQVSSPGAAAAGAAERVKTLKIALGELGTKAQLLAESLAGNLPRDLETLARSIGDFIDSIRKKQLDLSLGGSDSAVTKDTAVAGGVVGYLAARTRLGRIGSAVVGAAGAATTYLGAKALEVKDEALAQTAATGAQIIAALVGAFGALRGIFSKIRKPIEVAKSAATAASGAIEAAAVEGAEVAEATSVFKKLWGLLSTFNPWARLAAFAFSAYEIFDLIREYSKKDSPAKPVDQAALQQAIAQRNQEVVAAEEKLKQAQSQSSIADQTNEVLKNVTSYQALLSDVFGKNADEAAKLLEELGSTPLEADTKRTNEIKARLEAKAPKGIDERKFAELSKARAEFTAAQGTLTALASDQLEKAARIVREGKDNMDESEKAFIATMETLKDSPLFQPGAFSPENMVQSAIDLFRLLKADFDGFKSSIDKAKAERDRLLSQQSSSDIKQAFGDGTTPESRSQFDLFIRKATQNPTPDNLAELQRLKAETAKYLQESVAAAPKDAPIPQDQADRITALEDLQKQLDTAINTSNQALMTADEKKKKAEADAAEQKKIDEAKAKERAAEEEKASLTEEELAVARNNLEVTKSEYDQKVRLAEKEKRWDDLLKPGGLIDQRYEAEIKLAEAEQQLAAKAVKRKAEDAGLSLPKNFTELSPKDRVQVKRIEGGPDALSRLDQANINLGTIKRTRDEQKRLVLESSKQVIPFTESEAYNNRQTEIRKLKEQFSDSQKEGLTELLALLDKLYGLEIANAQEEIDHIKSQKSNYGTDQEGQAKYRIALARAEDKKAELESQLRQQRTDALDKAERKALEEEKKALDAREKFLVSQNKRLAQAPETTRRGVQVLVGTPPQMGGVSAGPVGGISQNAQVAYDYFIRKGLKPYQAAGIIGNFMQESSPDVVPGGPVNKEGGRGIAQWKDTRRSDLEAFASRSRRNVEDLQTQLDFMWSELQGPEKRAFRRLKSTSNVIQAAQEVSGSYERPGDPRVENRIRYAQQVMAAMQGSGAAYGYRPSPSFTPSGAPGTRAVIRPRSWDGFSYIDQNGTGGSDVTGKEYFKKRGPQVYQAIIGGAQRWVEEQGGKAKVMIRDLGRGPGDKGNHSMGAAADIQLVDKNGRVLPNYQPKGQDFRAYEKFWQDGMAYAMQMYGPDLEKYFRFGGYFSTPGKGKNPGDAMHADVSMLYNEERKRLGKKPATMPAGGTLRGGANDNLKRLFPTIVSQGIPGGDWQKYGESQFGPGYQIAGGTTQPAAGSYTVPGIPDYTSVLDQLQFPGGEVARKIEENRRLLQELDLRKVEIASTQAAKDPSIDPLAAAKGIGADAYARDSKDQSRQLDALRSALEAQQTYLAQRQSEMVPYGPAVAAARSTAGLAPAPADELQRLQSVKNELDGIQVAATGALKEAEQLYKNTQDLKATTEATIAGLEDQKAKAVASGDTTTANGVSAKLEYWYAYLEAVKDGLRGFDTMRAEFQTRVNEAQANIATNVQEQQNVNPTLMDQQVPVVGPDGTRGTVTQYGQLSQGFDFEAIAGELNNLAYSLKNLGKNIRGFIVGAIDTFVSTIADKLVKGASEVDTTALNQARADLYQAQGDASYNLAQQRKDLADAEAAANQMPGNEGAQARRADMQAAYAESSRSYGEAVNARQAQVRELEQQAQDQGVGGALKEAFTALSQDFAAQMLKGILLMPFQGLMRTLGSATNPIHAIVDNLPKSMTGDSAPGAESKGVLDSVIGPIEDIFYKIGDGFGSIFNSIVGALGSLGGGGGSNWIGSAIGAIAGFAGFADGGQVKGPGTGTSDSIPAWLSNGEYVLTAAEVQKIGVQNIEKWKSAMASPAKFATGGLVQTFDSVARNAANYSNAGATGGGTDVTIIDQRSQANSEPVSVNRTRGPDNKEVIQVMVRDAVKNAINSGMMDRTMRANYGARRTGAR